jgi:hypothetical protein
VRHLPDSCPYSVVFLANYLTSSASSVYSGFTRNYSISNPHTPKPEKLQDLNVNFHFVDFGGEMSSNAGCPSGFPVDFPM